MEQKIDIPVFSAKLPSADQIFPYLKIIDENKIYTNNGPLVFQFEAALADHFNVSSDRIVAVANATAGLTLSLLAETNAGWNGGRADGGLCVMPAWTHEASAVAAVRAGLTPWLHDVDENDWQLDPSSVAATGDAAAVLITGPFGAAVRSDRWAPLVAGRRVAVVVDGAGSFDAVCAPSVTTVVSLHATKIFGVGEGGAVVARNRNVADRIRDLARLGLSAERTMAQAGMNAKLSEYAAAVGLAAFDEWPQRRARLLRLRETYAASLEKNGARVRPWLPQGLSSTFMVRLPGPIAEETEAALRDCGIETRRWWHRGCHRQPAFAAAPQRSLPTTDALVESVLGLPFYDDLTTANVERVSETLASCVGRSVSRGFPPVVRSPVPTGAQPPGRS